MNNFPKVLIFRPGTAENSAVGRADKEILARTHITAHHTVRLA